MLNNYDIRKDSTGDEEGNEKNNYINAGVKFGHPSLDSNHVESQSEWSDDDCREEATGLFIPNAPKKIRIIFFFFSI